MRQDRLAGGMERSGVEASAQRGSRESENGATVAARDDGEPAVDCGTIADGEREHGGALPATTR